ncbi:MAG: Gx transporter family protein [Clostridiales bacterium]|nr:Gx transporter family protein [Clostridiales bacterium]
MKKVANYGVLVTLALVASYVETLIPISLGVPGAKIGLANLITIVALFLMGWKDAFAISIIRIVLAGFLFGNLFAIFYSLAGALLSLLIMMLLKKLEFGTVAVSCAGGVAHNIGQISFAALLVENSRLFYYLPILLIAGVLAGIVIGIIGGELIKRLKGVL